MSQGQLPAAEDQARAACRALEAGGEKGGRLASFHLELAEICDALGRPEEAIAEAAE